MSGSHLDFAIYEAFASSGARESFTCSCFWEYMSNFWDRIGLVSWVHGISMDVRLVLYVCDFSLYSKELTNHVQSPGVFVSRECH